MMNRDIYIHFGWTIDNVQEQVYNDMRERVHRQTQTGRYKCGGDQYGRTDPHDNDPFGVNDPPSGWYFDKWKLERPWPTSGNWIHEALMTYIQEPPYELPPTIYMRLSFDGTWYPHTLSSKKYTNTNHLKL